MKKTPLFAALLLLLLCSNPMQAQQDPSAALPDGAAYFPEQNDAQHPCITAEQYEIIEKQCTDNIKLLKLDHPQQDNVLSTSLNWPLRAAAGFNDCSFYTITAYVDHDATTGIKDWNCGTNTYDGHKGTDIAIWPFPFYKMDNNQVEVIAAAPGTIINKSDGNFDKNCAANNLTANYIVIQHADGSVALYFHMKKNSLTAKVVGQTVAVGEFLGVVGSSGSSSGPHLHFEVWAGSTVSTLNDPWAGSCNNFNANSWWAVQKPYTEPAIIKASVHITDIVTPACPATETPNESKCYPQPFQGPSLSAGAAKFYIFFRDETAGLVANMSILNPDGTTFSSWNYTSNASYNASGRGYTKFLPTLAGTYTYKAVYNGITCSQTFDVMTASISPAGTATVCAGGSTTLTANAGSAYLWSTGATTQSISVSTAGSYLVTVTNANGCAATSTATAVTVSPAPTASISPNGPTTFCQGGMVQLTAAVANSYAWSNGATTQSITVAASGSYTVTVSNITGCTAAATPVVVTVNPLPVAAVTPVGPTTFCQGGSVQLNAGPASTYSWSTGATTSGISVSAPGSYTVTVTSAAGCSAVSSATTVTVNPLPVANITPNGPTTFCDGNAVTLNASAASTYAWSNGATTSGITVSTAGNYKVTVTNATGCTAASTATTVTVNPLPTATIAPGGPTTFCQGGSVELSAGAGGTYAWSNGATTQNINATSSGNYIVTVTSANGCTKQSNGVIVTVNSLPVASITPTGPTTFCQGNSVMLKAGAASSYAWSTGATTSAISVSAAGSYVVTVTNINGCTAASTATTVTVNPLPLAAVTAGGPTTICQGNSVVLTAGAATGYTWSTGATTSAISVSAAGSYTVTVSNSNGCTAASSAITVVVNPLPQASIIAGGPTSFCQGGSVVLTAGQATSYLWSNGQTAQINTVSVSGNYAVTVSDANGCTAAAPPIQVTVHPPPTAVITAIGAPTFCQGGSVSLAANAAAGYLWSTGATTQNITASTSGNYSVVITDANGCHSGAAFMPVTVNPLPVASITPVGSTMFCQGGSVALTATAASGYAWSNGATTHTTTASTAGNYQVTITDANGCKGVSAPVAVVVQAPQNGLAIVLQHDTLVSPYSLPVHWYLAGNPVAVDSGLIHKCKQTGDYHAVGQDANGCMATSAVLHVVCTPTAVQSIQQLSQVQVYPNPTTDWLNVIGSDVDNGRYVLSLKNVIGQVVSEQTLVVDNNAIQTRIMTADLPAGVYFLVVERGVYSVAIKVVRM